MTMGATQLTWAEEIMLRNELQTKREDIRHAIRFKFAEVPTEVEAALDYAKTAEALIALFDRALAARTKDDLLRTSS